MMPAPTNQALLAGGAGKLRSVALPMPFVARDNDVLLRMLYAPVNPADLLSLDGTYAFSVQADAPLGAEGVGVVEKVGSAIVDIEPGDFVLPLDRGNWARYRAIDRNRLVKVPAGVDPIQASMMRINPPTAWGLLDASGAESGDCIIQNAAVSTVANWVRILAARRGIHVINVVRPGSPTVEGYIADGPSLVEDVRCESAGRPVRAALDCVAGESTGRLATCLSAGGQVIVFGHLSGQPSSIRSQLLTGQGLSVRGFSLRPAEASQTVAERDAMFATLWSIAREEEIRLQVRTVIGLCDADRAIDLARVSGGGRVLLDLQVSDM